MKVNKAKRYIRKRNKMGQEILKFRQKNGDVYPFNQRAASFQIKMLEERSGNRRPMPMTVVRRELFSFTRFDIEYGYDLALQAAAEGNFWGVYNVLDSAPYYGILEQLFGKEAAFELMSRIYLLAKKTFAPKDDVWRLVDEICIDRGYAALGKSEMIEQLKFLKLSTMNAAS